MANHRFFLVAASVCVPLFVSAWAPAPLPHERISALRRFGYLDNLSSLSEEEESAPNDSREATQMAKEQIDRYGPGNLSQFVDFNEFDGGDGRTLYNIYIYNLYVRSWRK
jgi:hypothetical protein